PPRQSAQRGTQPRPPTTLTSHTTLWLSWLTHATMAQALPITKAVVQAFGPRGGQAVPFSRELCARLRLCKSITPDEEARWQQFHRLPDHIRLSSPQARP